MARTTPQPKMALPIQAPPVRRDTCTTPAARQGQDGVCAAKSQCADMTGSARQTCYEALYGIST
jgi:hypothetical protein